MTSADAAFLVWRRSIIFGAFQTPSQLIYYQLKAVYGPADTANLIAFLAAQLLIDAALDLMAAGNAGGAAISNSFRSESAHRHAKIAVHSARDFGIHGVA